MLSPQLQSRAWTSSSRLVTAVASSKHIVRIAQSALIVLASEVKQGPKTL